MFESIEINRLRLRRFDPQDLTDFLAYRNDPEIARYQSWESTSEAQAQQFIEELQAIEPGTPGEWFQFAIADAHTNRLIGDCALHVLADEPRLGEIGYTLARAYHGQGYGQEAVRGLLGYCFETLQLHRVSATVDCRNSASIALLDRVGMRREGHFRKHMWFKGEWCDEFLYAMLQEEWQ